MTTKRWTKVTMDVYEITDVYAKARLFAELIEVRTDQVDIYVHSGDLKSVDDSEIIMLGSMEVHGYDPNDRSLIVEAYSVADGDKKHVGVVFKPGAEVTVEFIYDPILHRSNGA